MSFFYKFSLTVDAINEKVGKFVSWTTLLLIIVTFTDVVMRYFFNTSYVFTQELEWHIFAFIFLMGAGYTLKKDGHVRVEVFYGGFSKKGKAWIDFFGVLFFLVPSCVLFIKTSLPFAIKSFAIMEVSPNPGGIPFRFLLKGCIPLGYFLILLQGISLGIKSFYNILDLPMNKDISKDNK
ncbi:MAG: C4-dicarboxylate ABC transporter permease [Desulfobacteraceae bacterium 4572_130]|nr:MAG: C4-dicarboxylate ABC transporter permease [Desulfobacteraceae bacterium 4572_130]